MTTRNLVRSAQARAAIIAALTKVPKQTIFEISVVPSVLKLGLGEKAVAAIVYRLLQNGMLVKEKSEAGRMLYSANNDVVLPDHIEKPLPKKIRASTIADLKVDIIKATGRIRLTLNGFTVDIGVAG